MLVSNLQSVLRPFGLINNRAALSVAYKSLMITLGGMQGASSYAIIQCGVDLEVKGLDDPIFVDTAQFIAVISSLEPTQEVTFELQGGALAWQCGSAKGRLALLVVEEMPDIDGQPEGEPFQPTEGFIKALEVGQISCGNDSMASIGMYGIVLDGREHADQGTIAIYASDNITLSCGYAEDHVPGLDECVTLSPEAVKLLTFVITHSRAEITFDKDRLFIADEILFCAIKYLPPLKEDLSKMLDKFTSSDVMIPIPGDRVRAFIKRVNALTEAKRSAHLVLGIEEGRLTMDFAQGAIGSDEYILVEGLNPGEGDMRIKVDAQKMANALDHASHLVLDYMDRKVIVLEGDEGLFRYMISGSKA